MLHFSPATRRSTGEITLVVKGEGPGHPFRGNQYKKIGGGGKAKLVASTSGRKVREEDLNAQNELDKRYNGNVYIDYNVETYAVHLTRQSDIESLQAGIDPERGGGILGTGFYVTPPEGKIGQGRVMQGRDPANPVQVLVQVKMDKVLVLDGQRAQQEREKTRAGGEVPGWNQWIGASESSTALELLSVGYIGPTPGYGAAYRNRAVKEGIGGILYKPDSTARRPDWDTQICVLDPKTVTIKGIRPLQGGSQGGRAEEADRWQSTMADLMKSIYGRVLLVTPDQFDRYAKVEERRRFNEAKKAKISYVIKGDRPGHPFRGNQHVRVSGRMSQFSAEQRTAIEQQFQRDTGMTIDEAVNNTERLYAQALRQGLDPSRGLDWYKTEVARITRQAERLGTDPTEHMAVVAALSPRNLWSTKDGSKMPNIAHAEAVTRLYKPDQQIRVTQKQIDTLGLKHTKPGVQRLGDIDTRDLGRWMQPQVNKMAGYPALSQNITNALNIIRTGDINNNLKGPKTRAFFNQFVSNGRHDSSVIDAWVGKIVSGKRMPPRLDAGATAAGQGLKNNDSRFQVQIGGSKAQLGKIGTYPAYEEVVHLLARRWNSEGVPNAQGGRTKIAGTRGRVKPLLTSDVQAMIWFASMTLYSGRKGVDEL